MILEEFILSGSLIRIPSGDWLIGYGKPSTVADFRTGSSLKFLAPAYFFDVLSWFEHASSVVLSTEQLLDLLPKGGESRISWGDLDKSVFAEEFVRLQERIEAGVLLKGVPYLFQTSKDLFNASLLCQLLRHLVEYAKAHALFVYGYWDEGSGILGATPELLLHANPSKTQAWMTAAVAGTAPCDKEEELLKDPKMMREHQLVVGGISTSLSPYGRLEVHPTQANRHHLLAHLRTPIDFYPEEGFSFTEAIRRLHPTPALGASPREEGMKWLKGIEKRKPRGRYGAPFAVYHPVSKEAFSVVAIRNVQWDKQGMRIGVGCGVVQESILDAEWEELQLKLRSIHTLLGV